ncbi:hypothetical protein MAR_035574 [Mya arenaria]|uniref:Uncharacterized protein n=1 Tax=Mya arenaria TaxID=6604 RepID=A0ABY7EKH9_MYAAR|nr:hypothetical protein MAR_035574 [Mya arenaria]
MSFARFNPLSMTPTTAPTFPVCSKHFIDGRPTKQNPIPVLEMGYRPVTPKTPGQQYGSI